MQSTPLLPLLSGPLWLGVVAPDRVLSMGQIKLNWVLMLNWIPWNRTVLTFKLHHHHHHHVTLPARISLTLSRHTSLSSIAPGGLQGYILYRHRAAVYSFFAGRPAFARPCEGVHWSISLMSSSLLLQQRLACLVGLTWIVFVMGCRWAVQQLFCGVLPPDLFNIAHSILV